MSDSFQFIERARLLLDQGRTKEAMKQLANALQQNPDDEDALSLYARCQFDLKEYNAGIDTLYKALAIDPDNSYFYYLLGFGYYRKDDHSSALTQLQHSISINPYFAESYGLMAYVYCAEKNFKQALSKANEGLAVDPENITCLNVRSIAQNKLKMTDDAIETMQYALAQDPDNEHTHTTVGWNYLEKGKHKLAANHFREALRIDPDYHNAKEGLKEALKSKIAPYRWLLQYSFWVNNKGKKARWIIPLGLYFGVRILSNIFSHNKSTETIASVIIGLYLLFVITSWLINPLANMFLLFHKDGKYALDTTEKYTAITVVSSLLAGLACFIVLIANNFNKDSQWSLAFTIAALAFCGAAVPLGRVHYPISFKKYGNSNKVAMLLSALGLLTALLAFIYLPAAMITGAAFLILFVIDNWLGVFR